MKQILFLIPIFFLLTITAYYPGETISFNNELNSTRLVYTIIDNATPVSLVVNVTQNQVNLTFPQDLAPQSFEVVFIEESTHEVIKTVKVGGGTRTKYINQTVNNTIYIDRIIEKEIPIIENKTEVPQETEQGINKYKVLFYSCLSVLALIIFGWLFLREHRKEDKINGRKEETQ